jgi:hypothetical protein
VDVKHHFEFSGHHDHALTLVEVKPAKDYEGVFSRAAERGWKTVEGPKAVVKAIGTSGSSGNTNSAASSSNAASSSSSSNNATSSSNAAPSNNNSTTGSSASTTSNCTQGDLLSKSSSWWNPARSAHHKIQRMLMLYSEENKGSTEEDAQYESWNYGLVGQRVDQAWPEDKVRNEFFI